MNQGKTALRYLTEADIDQGTEDAYACFKAAADLIIGRLRDHQQVEISEATLMSRATLSSTLSGRQEWTIPKFAALCAAAGEDFVAALERGRDAVRAERDAASEQALRRLLAERTSDLVLEVARHLPGDQQQRLAAALSERVAQVKRRGGEYEVPETVEPKPTSRAA